MVCFSSDPMDQNVSFLIVWSYYGGNELVIEKVGARKTNVWKRPYLNIME